MLNVPFWKCPSPNQSNSMSIVVQCGCKYFSRAYRPFIYKQNKTLLGQKLTIMHSILIKAIGMPHSTNVQSTSVQDKDAPDPTCIGYDECLVGKFVHASLPRMMEEPPWSCLNQRTQSLCIWPVPWPRYWVLCSANTQDSMNQQCILWHHVG